MGVCSEEFFAHISTLKNSINVAKNLDLLIQTLFIEKIEWYQV